MRRLLNSSRYISIVGILLALSISVVYLAGCSNNSTAPEGQIPPDPKANWFDESAKDGNAALGPHIDLLGDLEVLPVGEDGGLLHFLLDGLSVEIKVPTGAVDEDVEITVDASLLKTVLGPIYLFDFGPDGLVFDEPITLYQPIPTGQRFAYLYYYNPDTKVWELQQAVRVVNGVAAFSIYHFSKYGIS